MSPKFNMSFVVPAALTALIAMSTSAHADHRAFTHTYEYMTMPEGQTELEIYTEQSRSTFDDDAVQGLKFQLELEHGITSRWDVSLYHVFEQETGPSPSDVKPLTLSELKLRSRYRFSERSELPVDVALYGEVVKAVGASVYELEGKLIAARDFGRVTVAAQPILAVEFGGDVAETELELGWAAGASYELSPKFKVGAETWGAAKEEFSVVEASAGPAVSWSPGESLWVTFTAGLGLNDHTDKFNGRAIIGLHL